MRKKVNQKVVTRRGGCWPIEPNAKSSLQRICFPYLQKVRGIMPNNTRQVYIMRVSQVATDKGPGWRISLVDTASQERFYFATFEALVQFLMAPELAAGQTPPEPPLKSAP